MNFYERLNKLEEIRQKIENEQSVIGSKESEVEFYNNKIETIKEEISLHEGNVHALLEKYNEADFSAMPILMFHYVQNVYFKDTLVDSYKCNIYWSHDFDCLCMQYGAVDKKLELYPGTIDMRKYFKDFGIPGHIDFICKKPNVSLSDYEVDLRRKGAFLFDIKENSILNSKPFETPPKNSSKKRAILFASWLEDAYNNMIHKNFENSKEKRELNDLTNTCLRENVGDASAIISEKINDILAKNNFNSWNELYTHIYNAMEEGKFDNLKLEVDKRKAENNFTSKQFSSSDYGKTMADRMTWNENLYKELCRKELCEKEKENEL